LNWVNCFRSEGETILGGMTAEEFHNTLSAPYTDMDEVKSIGNDNRFVRYKFLVKTHQDTYNEEVRTRFTALKVIKDGWRKDSDNLIEKLKSYRQEFGKELSADR